MTRGQWRLRVAQWLAPAGALAEPEEAGAPVDTGAQVPDVWTEVSEQFAWRLLVLTEQLRPALDGLESGEEDPDRLAQLYQIDHGVTRMRRVARDLRVLAGRGGEEIAGHTTSLLDVIRVANSSIEHYGRVTIGPVAELAVVAYAADDIASLLAALTDNATRYSPATVTVSAHLLADGGVMVRVEDSGLGIEAGWLGALNNVLAGPTPGQGVFNFSGRHTGFAVAHRLARRYGLRVQLARREPPGGGAPNGTSGTIAMVVIPPSLLCEIPGEPVAADGQQGSLPALTPADLRATRPPARIGPAPGHLPPPQDVPFPAQDVPLRAQDVSFRAQDVPLPLQDVPLPPQDVPLPLRELPLPEAPAPYAIPAPGGAGLLPRREPRSVRTPARQARAAAPEQAAPPDRAAEGFAFAADLQAFSAALGGGRGPATTDAGENQPGDAEGHRP